MATVSPLLATRLKWNFPDAPFLMTNLADTAVSSSLDDGTGSVDPDVRVGDPAALVAIAAYDRDVGQLLGVHRLIYGSAF